MQKESETLPIDEGFAAVADHRARILILGSMPGRASLQAAEYYAHPRNAFWVIIAHLLGFSLDTSYPQRLEYLKDHGIALWDVVHQCQRPGSLDQHIVTHSIVPNDFGLLFRVAPQIKVVFCNGQRAHSLYMKWIIPRLPSSYDQLPVTRLPSTSPAHANMTLEEKMQHWRSAITPYMNRSAP